MKYLGIDYGKRKVGLAVSEGQLASPLKVLQVSSLKDAVTKISQAAEAEQVEELVIGIPESGEAKKMAEEGASELEKKFQVRRVGETLSTQQAKSDLMTMGFSREKRREEDSRAAAIILQTYLDGLL